MEAVSTLMVAAAKRPMLNPCDFELWKMRIEQYFLMTDYALWEVIVNGNSPPLKKTVDGVEQTYPPTSAKEKLVRKNELKARGTLLMALPNEHQLKFNTYKSAKSLMETIEKSFRAFVSSNINGSTNEAVKTAHGVFATNSKANSSNLPNVDSLSDVVIYSFLASQGDGLKVVDDNADYESKEISQDNRKESRAPKQQDNRTREPTRKIVPVEETNSKALVSLYDRFGYDWSDQAKEGPTNFTLMAYTPLGSSSSSISDSEISTCSKACLKSYEAIKEHYDNLTKDFKKSQLNVGAYKAGLESVEARLEVYKKNEAVFEEDIKILKLDVMLRDNALTKLRKKFEKAEKERDDLKLTLEKFETSSKNLSKLLDIQVCDKYKTGVGFDSQVFESQVFDYQVNDKYKTGEGYHGVPPPYTRNFMPPKPDLVLADVDEYVASESVTSVPAVAISKAKTSELKPKSASEPLIKDWTSDSEDENETKSKQRKPSYAKVEFVKTNEHVKSPRESVKKVENNKQAKYPRKNSQSPRGNFVPKAVLMKSGLKMLNTANQNSSKAAVSVNTARQNSLKVAVSVNTARLVNTAFPKQTVNCAKPISNVFNRAHSHVKKPFNKFPTNRNSNFNEKVNIVKGNVITAGPKAVGNPHLELQEKGVIDSGCSRHMTRNMSIFLIMKKLMVDMLPLEETPKEVKLLVKKNSVLFTDTERIVLSPDLKLSDENHVLLKVPRKDTYLKVKVIRCDNGIEFKNRVMNQFCEMKGIKREFSVARTPQQNGVAERKNRTLIEAARTMLADSKLPTFLAEVVNTACYV
ncbi:retrovirus-related pol polyprotein from transposon TNT 1-94 [Tanacetum coccineum]